MFKLKKEKSPAAEAAVAPVIGGGSSIGRFALIMLVGVAVVLLLIGGSIQLLFQQQLQQRQSSQIEQQAQALARRISDRVGFYAGELRQYSLRPQLAQLLIAEDAKGLRRQERLLSGLLPQVLRVRLLPVDWDQPEPDANPPFSFASLQMLRDVERSGQPSPAEVHQFGSPGQHIAMAAPINDPAGELVGVVHIALAFTPLREAVEQLGDASGGHLELQQMTQQRSLDMVLSSGGDRADENMLGKVPIEGAIWRIAYWMDKGSIGEGVLTLWGVIGTALLLVALLLLLLTLRHRRALRHDQAALLAQVEALLSGSRSAVPRAELPEFKMLMGLFRQLTRARRDDAAQDSDAETAARSRSYVDGDGAAVSAATDDGMLSEDDLLLDDPAQNPGQAIAAASGMPAEIFRAYDIRGQVGSELTPKVVYEIGRAIGSEAHASGQQTVIVGRDGRNSSEQLSTALCRGLMASGRDVVDIGLVPTPVLYFATHYLGSSSGVMVTGSHNPPEYNGLKVVIDGAALSEDGIQRLRQRIEQGDLQQGEGSSQEQDLIPDYINRITEDVQLLKPLKIVIDCGNGAASVIAPALFRMLGCEVTDLFCKVDGDFPNHHPDPGKPENLISLIKTVKSEQADLGIAFDGDGDRLGVVDANGQIIWPDRLLMLLARDVLMRQPGADVIYDVKSSRHLAGEILAYGGRPIMWKSGHSLVKAKLRETGALLAGEMSGHIFFKERWYGFDDGLYSCARLLEVLSAEAQEPVEVFAQLPNSIATPELLLPLERAGEGVLLVQQLTEQGRFDDAKLVTIDGIRAEFSDGWGLARPSNTVAAVTFRFEADDEASLARIQGVFREQLLALRADLELPF